MSLASSPIELTAFIGITLGSTLFSLILCWIFQRKSAAHPVRNGILSAAIPSILLSFVGSVQKMIMIIGGSDGPSCVFITIHSAVVGASLFAFILLPTCILLCKKLSKKHSVN